MNIKRDLNPFLIILIVFATYVSIFVSCQPEIITQYVRVPFDKEDTGTSFSNNNTVTEFWGLSPILFKNWRPNIHIKASTDNGALSGRVWDGTPDIDPDDWSLFEFSQVVYYDSDYNSFNIQPDEDATVDNFVIMPLSFEQKLYKRVSAESTESNKYDVTYDQINKSVVITLNTVNSNYLSLKNGARIAVFATQRPGLWGGAHDYTIVDSFPKGSSLQTLAGQQKYDTSVDRAITRTLNYIEYTGGTMYYPTDSSGDNSHWFKNMKIEPDIITIYMPFLTDGNTAKNYWDEIDIVPLAPFMLFWIVIQQ